MGAAPRQSWLGPATGCGGVGGPSPILAEAPMHAAPRHSWLGPVAWFASLVPRLSWRRALQVRFSAYPGRGLPLALVGGGVPHQSWRWALWVPFLASPGWDLVLVRVVWLFAFPGVGPCGRCAPPFPVGACRWLWWGGPPPVPVVDPVVVASWPP